MKMSVTIKKVVEDKFNFNDKFIPLFNLFENCTLNEIWDKIGCIEDNEDLMKLWDEFTDFCYENDIFSVTNNIGIEFFEA